MWAQMDHAGMALIEAGDVDAFRAYLEETGNTICGRHPICVLLEALRASRKKCGIKFVRYAQSSAAVRPSDSSVSYAAALVTSA